MLCVVCVSPTGRSLVLGGPNECGVSECDGEASIMRRPWSTGGLLSHDGGGDLGSSNERGINNRFQLRQGISSPGKGYQSKKYCCIRVWSSSISVQ